MAVLATTPREKMLDPQGRAGERGRASALWLGTLALLLVVVVAVFVFSCDHQTGDRKASPPEERRPDAGAPVLRGSAVPIVHASAAPGTDGAAVSEGIRVRVVLRDRSSPVDQCEVSLETGTLVHPDSGPAGSRRVKRTGRDGTALFANASSGFLDVVDEYYRLPGGRTYVEGPGEVRLEVISRRGGVVTLLDAETGTPLSGWAVRPLILTPEERVLPTDGNGRTQLPWSRVPPTTLALSDGRNAFGFLVTYGRFPYGRSQTDVQFELARPNRSTRVRVTDADARPVADATIFACHRDTGLSIAADAEGQATVEYVGEVPIEVAARGKLTRRVYLSGEPTVEIRLVDARTRRFTFDQGEPRTWYGECSWTLSYEDEVGRILFSGTQQSGVMDVPDLPAGPFRCTVWAYGPDGVTHYVEVDAPAIEQAAEVAVAVLPPRTLRLELGAVTAGATEPTPVQGGVWVYSEREYEWGREPGSAMASLRDMVAGRGRIGRHGGLSRMEPPTIQIAVPAGIPWSVGVLADDGAYGRTVLRADEPSGTRVLTLEQVEEDTPTTLVRVEWSDGRAVAMSTVQILPEGSSESAHFGFADAVGMLLVGRPPGRYRLRTMKDDETYLGDRAVLVPGSGPQVVRMLPETER